jgi:hypothetical protein
MMQARFLQNPLIRSVCCLEKKLTPRNTTEIAKCCFGHAAVKWGLAGQ